MRSETQKPYMVGSSSCAGGGVGVGGSGETGGVGVGGMGVVPSNLAVSR